MVVVVLLATGATVALKAYNSLKESNEHALEKALFSIQQQAGVLTALCAAVFAVITALRTGKSVTTATAAAAATVFGTKTASTATVGA